MEVHDFIALDEHSYYQADAPPSDMQWNGSYHRQLMHILQDFRSIWHCFLASISEVSEQIPAEEMFQEASNRCSSHLDRASL